MNECIMNEIKITAFGNLTIGHSGVLNDGDVADIGELIRRPAAEGNAVLGGRRQVDIFRLRNGRSVAVKHYARGGMIGHVIKQTYLRRGATRAENEFRWLARVRRLGLSAPEPLAFAVDGSRLYRCWLVTAEVPGHRTLADISVSDPFRARRLLPVLADQAAILIANGILHVDFHPGNVLADGADQLFVIDFDKARHYRGGKHGLAKKYCSRWRRAVIKHRLPDWVAGQFSDAMALLL